MNGAEYMGRVAQLACGICPVFPVEVHHKRSGTGMGRRASDFQTMPLCPEHHRGKTGIHGLGTKLFARTYGVTEEALVEAARNAIGCTAEEIQVWEQAVRDRGRKVSKPARGKPTPKTPRAASLWPSRKLASRSSFPPRARGKA